MITKTALTLLIIKQRKINDNEQFSNARSTYWKLQLYFNWKFTNKMKKVQSTSEGSLLHAVANSLYKLKSKCKQWNTSKQHSTSPLQCTCAHTNSGKIEKRRSSLRVVTGNLRASLVENFLNMFLQENFR